MKIDDYWFCLNCLEVYTWKQKIHREKCKCGKNIMDFVYSVRSMIGKDGITMQLDYEMGIEHDRRVERKLKRGEDASLDVGLPPEME